MTKLLSPPPSLPLPPLSLPLSPLSLSLPLFLSLSLSLSLSLLSLSLSLSLPLPLPLLQSNKGSCYGNICSMNNNNLITTNTHVVYMYNVNGFKWTIVSQDLCCSAIADSRDTVSLQPYRARLGVCIVLQNQTTAEVSQIVVVCDKATCSSVAVHIRKYFDQLQLVFRLLVRLQLFLAMCT